MKLICGLSGSGKSSLISSACDYAPAQNRFISGSKLLRSADRPINKISIEQAYQNQKALQCEIIRLHADSKQLLLDGHMLIETIEGPFLVPDLVLEAFNLSEIVLVRADLQLVRRRGLAAGLSHDIEDLFRLFEMESNHAHRFAHIRSIRFSEIAQEDTGGLVKLLEKNL